MKKYRTILYALAMLAIFIVFEYGVQFSTPNLVDNDGFYHIKMAFLMRTQGLKPPFPYLPLTILNPQDYVDHHFLFHVFQIPFTLGDLRLGAKYATVFFAALAFLSIWYLFYKQRVPYAGLWGLAVLAVSEAFIFRMNSPRDQSLSLAVLALATNLLMLKKFWLLLPLAFLYVWMYDAFPLIIVIACIYGFSALLVEGREKIAQEGLVKGVWKLAGIPVAFTVVGVLLGMLINPYFPQNVIFFIRHVGPKLTNPTSTNVGSEWYPYNTWQIVTNSPVSLVTFILGIFSLGYAGKRMSTSTAMSMFLALVFCAMLFQARRYIEYFPPFSLIFAAMAFRPLVESTRNVEDRLQSEVSQGAATGEHVFSTVGFRWRPAFGNWRSVLSPLLGLVILTPLILYNYKASRYSVGTMNEPYQKYANASAWLVNHTPQGSRVFQTDWDYFPRLFFYNTHNTYLVGLDPTYMQLYNPALYDEWVDITQGRGGLPSTAIKNDFGCSYVLTPVGYQGFLNMAYQDKGLEEVYSDQYAVVFKVR